MWSRRIITVLLALFAGLFDATLAVWWPSELSAIRLSLPLVTVLAAFSVPERALTAALMAGVVSDIFQPSSASLVTLRLVAVALAVGGLSRTLFTNRSLLGALALGLLALGLDRSLAALIVFGLSSVIKAAWLPEVRAAWWAETVWQSVCVSAVFLLFASFTKRFLPPLSRHAPVRPLSASR